VLVPEPRLVLVPTVQTVVLPALAQVLPPPVFQDFPLQLLPLEVDEYALVHPELFCELDAAATCEALAEELAGVAPGFGTSILDGPEGYGVYLTYQEEDAA
jgi:hypothetical protein